MDLYFPAPIRRRVDGLPFAENHTGMSGARVLLFPDFVLKIGPESPKDDDTVRVMRWLEGRLPAPRVLAYEKEKGYGYLLMSRIGGEMACHRDYLSRPDVLLPLLAEALHLFWRADCAGCPRNRSVDVELREARERVEKGLVDVERAEADTFGPGGFASPEKLLQWLEDNRPPMEPVLSHGDFCLPNIFLKDGRIAGFIDLGDTGVGDKWRDIALCLRSLRHNTDGTYGFSCAGYTAERFFGALGTAPDEEKLRYYTLLDELF